MPSCQRHESLKSSVIATAVAIALFGGCAPSDSIPIDTGTAMAPAPATSASTDAPFVTPAEVGGDWHVSTKSDPMDDVTNVDLSLTASQSPSLPFPYNDTEATLYIRCRKNETDLFVVTHVPVTTSYGGDYEDLGSRVRYRFDGGKPIASYWSEATDHSAVFAPEPVTLAKKLAKTTEWIFEFTPYDAASVSATFHPKGLTEVLPNVSKACHWR